MSNQEDLQAINLNTPSKEEQEVEVSPAPVDPWAVDETAAQVEMPSDDAANQEEEEKLTDTQEALSKLKVSGARLGSAVSATAADLDKKLGVSGVIQSFGSKVREVDEQTQVSSHVSTAVKGVSSTLGAIFGTVDNQLQISTKSKEIGGALGSQVSGALESSPVKNTTSAVQNFDETHGITRNAASALAAGADMLANVIAPPPAAPSGDDVKLTATVDAVERVDDDGLPSSFQK